MEEKKFNKSIVLSIIAVLILVIVVAGATYAYFRTGGETSEVEITTADLGINFVDGELLNAKLEPIEREDVLSKAAKKTFTITNTGEEKLFVHISMEDVELPPALKRYDFMWSLYEDGKNLSNGVFEAATGTSVDIAPYQVFEKDVTKVYTLYVWIEETGIDQNDMMGQTFKTTVKAVGESYHATPETCFTFNNGTITDYNVDTCGTDVIIPETIGGVAVTRVGDWAFTNDDENGDAIGKGITSVVIPNTVTEIGMGAFYDNKLTSLFIPNSITDLYYNGILFSNNQLTSVSIPNSVTDIGDFVVDNDLTSVFIPDSVTNMSDGAFWGNKLTSVIIPNSVTRMGIDVFRDNQLENVIIGNGLKTIESATNFISNANLNEIVIRSSEEVTMCTDEIWENCFDENWNCVEGDQSTCTKTANVIYAP